MKKNKVNTEDWSKMTPSEFFNYLRKKSLENIRKNKNKKEA